MMSDAHLLFILINRSTKFSSMTIFQVKNRNKPLSRGITPVSTDITTHLTSLWNLLYTLVFELEPDFLLLVQHSIFIDSKNKTSFIRVLLAIVNNSSTRTRYVQKINFFDLMRFVKNQLYLVLILYTLQFKITLA